MRSSDAQNNDTNKTKDYDTQDIGTQHAQCHSMLRVINYAECCYSECRVTLIFTFG
jgi:hypothetical protein